MNHVAETVGYRSLDRGIGRRGSHPNLKDLTNVRTPQKKLGDATMLPLARIKNNNYKIVTFI